MIYLVSDIFKIKVTVDITCIVIDYLVIHYDVVKICMLNHLP